MDEAREKPDWQIVATVVLALVAAGLGLYVGSYILLVERGVGVFSLGTMSTYYGPSYRVGGELADSIFTPIHQVDRRLREAYWRERVSLD